MIVMLPLFCNGENAFRSVSINSKSFGNGDHVSVVLWPGVALTLTHLVFNRTPEPLSGVTPSFTKAERRKVFNVPGPVFRTFEPTVHPLPVRPAPWAELPNGLGTAMAESKTMSPWNPM